MSILTLAISCSTTYNLPWFINLTFQVPMQYCSLQHRTLFASTVTLTTECCCCFGSTFSFFLELFLHWSPVAYWAPTNQGSSTFSILYFAFSYWTGKSWFSFQSQRKAIPKNIQTNMIILWAVHSVKPLICSLKDLCLTTYLPSIFCLPFFFFKVLFSTVCEVSACVVPHSDCQGLLRVQPFWIRQPQQ